MRAFKENDTKCTKYSKNQKNKEELSMNRLKGKIAVITGMPAGTIKSHLSRGKTKLTTFLKQNGYDGKR